MNHENTSSSYGDSNSDSNSNHNFQLLCQSNDIKGKENFTQGCQLSPDGSCILTCTSYDHTYRLYNNAVLSSNQNENISVVEEEYNNNSNNNSSSNDSNNDNEKVVLDFTSALNIQEGDAIRSYDWYPFMSSSDANSSVFISSARDQPLHLLDAYTGKIRCSYRAYNAVDAIESAQTVTFTPDGQRIVAGYNRYIKMFYTGMPGREYDTLRLGKSRHSKDGQKGIVSCISFRDADVGCAHVFAVGTYAGSIYLYDDRIPSSIAADVTIQGTCVVGHGKHNRNRKQKRKFCESNTSNGNDIFTAAREKWFEKTVGGGVTQLKWSSDSNYLFSASRRSDHVICWDMRCLTSQDAVEMKGVASFSRKGMTNQHIGFDLNDNTLFVGSYDGTVRVYDVKRGNCDHIISCNDSVNGVSYNKDYNLLSVSTGCRRFQYSYDADEGSSSDSEEHNNTNLASPGGVFLYRQS